MKRIFCASIVALTLGIASFASTSETVGESISTNTESPQVCQFSLSSYTGTVTDYGSSGIQTEPFVVRLSCPQTTDVHATVGVYIDKELVASDVVTIKANKITSASTKISVSSTYKGKKYNLIVE